MEIRIRRDEYKGQVSTLQLFVSLYLILLAFFVILTRASEDSVARSAAAVNSVRAAFSRPVSDTSDALSIEQEKFEITSKDDFLTSIEGLFEAEFSLKGRYSGAGGEVLQVELPVAYLFDSGSTEIRPDSFDIIEDIISVSQNVPASTRLEVAFLFGVGPQNYDPIGTRRQTIATKRAGNLARAFRYKGLSDGSYATGFVQIPEDMMLAAFHRSYAKSRPLALPTAKPEPEGETSGGATP